MIEEQIKRVKKMDLKSRIERLESLIGVSDDGDPPMIIISVMDCSKDSKDSEGIPTIAIIPGRIGSHGFDLTRGKTEAPADFLKRSEKKYSEFYP
jgi:hypothetical protein